MKLNDLLRELTQPGTPACGLLCGLLGLAAAALLLWIGLWKTLFVGALCLAGVFLGGVKDKGAFLKRTINRFFPPKDNQ